MYGIHIYAEEGKTRAGI